jgi:hypothetical protein
MATASAAALLLVGAAGVAQASPPTAASATFTQTALTSSQVQFAGPNIIIEQTKQGSVIGTLSGSFEVSLRLVIHPDGRSTAQANVTCQCTVDGKEGVLELKVMSTGQITSPTTAVFKGSAVITGGTGELSGLSGVFDMQGTVDLASGLATETYSGQIHFDP